jgi:ribosomal-protein-alanine N-acetyltransferase
MLNYEQLTFDKADRSELEEILDLHNLCHEYDQWPLERLEQVFEYELPVIVARADSKIVGLLIYLICLEEVRIINLAIHPLYRQNMLASKFLDNLIEEARHNNWRYILLDVRKSNLAAVNLYTKFGFSILCTRKDFYNCNPPIEDAYFMQLELSY